MVRSRRALRPPPAYSRTILKPEIETDAHSPQVNNNMQQWPTQIIHDTAYVYTGYCSISMLYSRQLSAKDHRHSSRVGGHTARGHDDGHASRALGTARVLDML